MAHAHLAHLADAARLTEGADGAHVALVPGAELWGVVVGGGIQGEAGMHVPGGLQVVALTERGEKDGETGGCVLTTPQAGSIAADFTGKRAI